MATQLEGEYGRFPRYPWQAVEAPAEVLGRGRGAALPVGIEYWSWGAFFLNWIWALGNRTYVGLLALVGWAAAIDGPLLAQATGSGTAELGRILALAGPGLVVATSLVLGMKGRAWAWRHRRWDGVAHFQRAQRRWSVMGIAVAAVVGAGVFGVVATSGAGILRDLCSPRAPACAWIEPR